MAARPELPGMERYYMQAVLYDMRRERTYTAAAVVARYDTSGQLVEVSWQEGGHRIVIPAQYVTRLVER